MESLIEILLICVSRTIWAPMKHRKECTTKNEFDYNITDELLTYSKMDMERTVPPTKAMAGVRGDESSSILQCPHMCLPSTCLPFFRQKDRVL